jgi:predicted regulator of amino acid metabolism with ACT domain
MNEHLRLYKQRKKVVRDIICEGCIVRANCSEYCEDIDYLIIMCADARNQVASKTELEGIAKEVKENKIQLERSNEGNFGI